MKLSIVIPAYNEEDNIEECILDVSRNFPNAEIIVINDASTDKTREILRTLQLSNLRVLTNPTNRGHGNSVVRGLRIASGDYILYIDADRQIDYAGYEFWNYLGSYDFISGQRIGRQDKPFRKFISLGLKMTIFLRFGYYVKDANCPFKVYRRSVVQAIISTLPKTKIIPIACLEVLARKHGYQTETIQIIHKPYMGERKGFLQSINPKSLLFIWKAFWEIVWL